MSIFNTIFTRLDVFTLTAIIILLIMSVISWTVVIFKYATYKNLFKSSLNFIELANKAKFSELISQSEKQKPNFAVNLFLNLVRDFNRYQKSEVKFQASDYISLLDKSSEAYLLEASSKLDSKLGVLATIGAISPFVGLLGTVTAVVKTLNDIGFSENSIQFSVTAPGLSSALIATAVGLFVAIPAVIFYNYFRSKNKYFLHILINFQNQIFNRLIVASK